MHGCRHNLCEQCLHEVRASKIDAIHCQFCENSCVKIGAKSFAPNRSLVLRLQKQGELNEHSSETSNSVSNSSFQPEQ
jgi:hypothetical protein